ncbi:hypothetical protein CYMTET_15216 [Cymbomonas tetramitiformis]|uniref:J domain-containing protein n=1 Tax=Cymbomonas tetramitiformis TaxID=36881 RepID=A0AAE0GET1_9CHLO|nr:hypothetical protein CYMTET_15216 [Cymbomonas tetramitiformis]
MNAVQADVKHMGLPINLRFKRQDHLQTDLFFSRQHLQQRCKVYLRTVSRHRHRRTLCRAESGEATKDLFADERDYYDLLEVSPEADVATIKSKFRKLQKRYHPDVSDDGGVMSARLNAAYNVLVSKDSRSKYDRKLRETGAVRYPVQAKEGLVGPVQGGALLFEDTLQCNAAAEEDALCSVTGTDHDQAVHYIRQWAQTLAYGAEFPLPTPLQVDIINDGVRIGFITVTSQGSIKLLGELILVVVPELTTSEDSDVLEPRQTWGLQVRRQHSGGSPEGPFPGEDRVLAALDKAVREIRGEKQRGGLELSGTFAAFAQGLLGSIPFWGGMNGGNSSSYEAYYLKPDQEASLEPLPERWIREKGNAMSYMQWGGRHYVSQQNLPDEIRSQWEEDVTDIITQGDAVSGVALTGYVDKLCGLNEQMTELLGE